MNLLRGGKKTKVGRILNNAAITKAATLSLASTHTHCISSAVKDNTQREEKAELALHGHVR